MRAAVHVAVSFIGFALLPTTLGLLLALTASHAVRLCVVFTLLHRDADVPAVQLGWLIARIRHDLLGGTPHGGHPVSSKS